MNSLKLTRRSGRWNLVETFHIRSPTTKSAVQNNKLFNVEFTQKPPKLDRPSDLPKCQDYHGLRSVRYPKRLVDFVARHPHDAVGAVNNEGHAVTCSPGHFTIDQEVLQLLPSAKSERAEAVAGPPAPNGERASFGVVRDDCHGAIARGCTKRVGCRSDSQLSRHDAPSLGHPYFSGYWQWIVKRVGFTS